MGSFVEFAKSNGLVGEDGSRDMDEYDEADAFDDDDEVGNSGLLNCCGNLFLLFYCTC